MVEIIKKTKDIDKIDLVNSNFSESLSWQTSSKYLDEWAQWTNMYRSIAKGKTNTCKWMSNRFIPMTFSKVETAYSNLLSMLFAVNPPFEVRPRERGDEVQANLIQRLLKYQFDEAEVFGEYAEFLKSLCIYGTGIGKIIWDVRFDKRTEWRKQYEPIMSVFGMNVGQKFLGEKPQEVDYECFRGPRFINCNLSDIFPDPTSINIQDGWVIHRTYRPIDYLRDMHDRYPEIYNANVLKIVDEETLNYNKSQEDMQSSLGRLSKTSVTRPKYAGEVELYEWWGQDIDPKDNKLKPRVLTIANGKYLVRDTNNPYWHGKNPFVKGCYVPSINEFYGIGLAEICEDMQLLLNETVNQRIDNISLALNRIIVYNRNSNIQLDNLRSEPGIRIGVDDDVRQAVNFLETPIYTGDSFNQGIEIERWLQEATAVTKLTLGMQGKEQNDTATGMSILQRASGDRFMTIAKIIENVSFKEIIKQFYQLDYQFIDQDLAVRIIGEDANEWIKISPSDVRRNYDFIPAGIFTMENKGQKVMKLLQFKQVTRDDPTVRQTVINKQLYYALELGDNPKELMRDDAEMQEIEQIAVMKAMQMMKEGAGGISKAIGGIGGNSGQFQQGSVAGSNQVPPPTPPATMLGE